MKFLDVHLGSGSHEGLGKGRVWLGLWVHITHKNQGMKEDLRLSTCSLESPT